MLQPLNVIIVETVGTLKPLSIKDFKKEELYKKCGFKKENDFNKQVEWNVKLDGKVYIIQVFAKTNGRANFENKYDFPPPIDNKLFFGSCAIIALLKKSDESTVYSDLSLPLWIRIYEKLFGGFEDLAATALEDEEEEDELFVSNSEEEDADEEESTSDEDIVIEDIGSELSEESYEYEIEVNKNEK